MKWFKHESSAHMNAKLTKLRIKYGMEGYGLYWYCLELIANEVDGNKFTFELEHDAEIISHHTNIHYELVNEMMTFMVNLGLFEEKEGIITCLKLAKRLDERWTKSDELKKVIRGSEDLHKKVSRGLALDKNRLEENRKEKKNRGFSPPTPQEVQSYLDEKGIKDFTGEDFVNFYAATDWYRGKTKIKSWRHCVGTWRKGQGGGSQPEQWEVGAI